MKSAIALGAIFLVTWGLVLAALIFVVVRQ